MCRNLRFFILNKAFPFSDNCEDLNKGHFLRLGPLFFLKNNYKQGVTFFG
jgi:hypothetical protein